MKFSYNWLKEYIPDIPDPKKTAGDLNMRIFEVEEVQPIGRDWALDIKVLPNRAFDCLSHLGIAREIAAIENIEFKMPKVSLREDKGFKIKDYLSVEVREPKLCPRYSARVVVDVKVGESPEWLKEKLEVCGLRSINNIVDITNYVMLECGQPLHAFDLDKLGEKKIIVRRAGEGEKINTLDEGKAQRILNENILVIADAQNPVAIAGIKGGRLPEISASTKKVALEAANFDPVNIRRSSKTLNLRTDASMRFENGLDCNLTIWSLDRAAALVAEIAGGQVAAGIIDISAVKRSASNTGVAHNYIESLLGKEIASSEVLNIFKRLGLEAKQLKKNKEVFYEIKVPTRRGDLLTSEDLIEEVGRLYGYENIPAKLPVGVLIPAFKNEELIYADDVRDILVGLGFSEVYNYSFVGENDRDFYNFQDLTEVLNPLSQEQKYLRPNLAAGLIKNLKENLRYFHSATSGFKKLKLFELGRIFYERKNVAIEDWKVGGLIYFGGERQNDTSFYEAKGTLEILCNKLGLVDVWGDDFIAEGLPANWQKILHSKKTAQLKVGQTMLGWVGEINPEILEELGIEGRPTIWELNFDKLAKLVSRERTYQEPSRYPAVTRDVAVLLGSNVKVEAVTNIIENTGGLLLADVDLFDIYEGEDLADGQKSLAFHLIWQSLERNLSDAEVNDLMAKIVAALEEAGWEIRK